jgi:sialic acid synthase SpsE
MESFNLSKTLPAARSADWTAQARRKGRMEIIAEIGQNHNGDMALAARLIRLAKENGADVAKFQLYDARKLFPKEGNPWYEYNLKTELSRENVDFLANECAKTGIEFMASVFDVERIAWLENAGVKRHKIASRSIKDTALVEALTATGKPIIASLGMWDGPGFPRIEHALPIQFLYCVSKYPTAFADLRLLEVDFEKYAGFSDHTLGVTASMAAFARGAGLLEKHLTADKGMYGPDHACSMTPGELRTIHEFRTELAECL